MDTLLSSLNAIGPMRALNDTVPTLDRRWYAREETRQRVGVAGATPSERTIGGRRGPRGMALERRSLPLGYHPAAPRTMRLALDAETH